MFREIWKDLRKSIYVGERLEQNLKALKYVSIITAILGLILIPVNVVSGDRIMLIAAMATFISAVACWFCAAVLKNRDVAILIPVLFCTTAARCWRSNACPYSGDCGFI